MMIIYYLYSSPSTKLILGVRCTTEKNTVSKLLRSDGDRQKCNLQFIQEIWANAHEPRESL